MEEYKVYKDRHGEDIFGILNNKQLMMELFYENS